MTIPDQDWNWFPLRQELVALAYRFEVFSIEATAAAARFYLMNTSDVLGTHSDISFVDVVTILKRSKMGSRYVVSLRQSFVDSE